MAVGVTAGVLVHRLPLPVRRLLPQNLASLIAAHDLGKVSPGFQLKCPAWDHYQAVLESTNSDGIETNHARISQWFLESVPHFKTDHRKAIDWVLSTGGHHGAYATPRAGGWGMTRPWEGSADWPTAAREELLAQLIEELGGLPSDPIDFKHESFRVHLLTGLTIFSDWIGSSENWFPLEPDVIRGKEKLEVEAESAAAKLGFGRSRIREGVSFGEMFCPKAPSTFKPRPLQEALIAAMDSPGLYIVEAPMGMGKTEAALAGAYRRWTEGEEQGLYFALPTQLTSNRIHRRISRFLDEIVKDRELLALIHANSWLSDDRLLEIRNTYDSEAGDFVEARQWFASTRKALLARYGTGTVDQALLSVLPARFSALRYFALAGKVVVIDEVHSYDPYTSALVDRLCDWLLKARCSVVILSATLTRERRRLLVESAGAVECEDEDESYPMITKLPSGGSRSERIRVPGGSRENRVKLSHFVAPSNGCNPLWQKLADHVSAGANVVVIRSTVALAQETFRFINAQAEGELEIRGLLHSRFPQFQRNKNEGKWMEYLGKDDRHRPRGSLLVATQVVEQSVDIDADLLVTDLAPTDLILQRMGRLHRHDRERPAGFEEPECWMLHPDTDWTGTQKKVEGELGPARYIYPPFSLWQASETWKYRESVSLPVEIRAVLEESAARELPDPDTYPAVTSFGADYEEAARKMRNTAGVRDVFNAQAIPDEEGRETRWKIKPTLPLVLVIARPEPVGREFRVRFLSGDTLQFDRDRFNMPLARALHENAVSVPLYWIDNLREDQPDWLKNHLRGGVLGVVDCQKSEIDLDAESASLPFLIHYSTELGVWTEKNPEYRKESSFGESDDYWF